MIQLFKSRKSAMVLIGIVAELVLGFVTKIDVTNHIVMLVGLYVTGNVAQKATQKKEIETND